MFVTVDRVASVAATVYINLSEKANARARYRNVQKRKTASAEGRVNLMRGGMTGTVGREESGVKAFERCRPRPNGDGAGRTTMAV